MRLGRTIFILGALAFAVAFVVAFADARATVFATWRPFVLVTGLLLVGLVAHENGIFDRLGRALARAPIGETAFVIAGLLLVAAVTALLNLDTAAAFLTPVLLLGVMYRGKTDERLLYGALFMCNAASLLLPGSNLTNLIVLSSEHRTGSDFARALWPAFVAAVAVTAAFVVFIPRRRSSAVSLVADGDDARPSAAGPVAVETRQSTSVVAVLALAAAVVLMLTVSDPAAAVLLIGVVASAIEIARRRMTGAQAWGTVDPALLLGLFGIAVALGTVGRGWHWPSSELRTASAPVTAAVAAVASVLCNNLPSAALLGARPVGHPRALLVGLNLGPNLAVTGSLSALLWYRTTRAVGARPRLPEVTRLGIVLVPLSIAAALLALRCFGAGSV